MTPGIYKANTDRLRSKPLLAALIGGLLLVWPWALAWLHRSEGLLFVGIWGAWMLGSSLWWSKKGAFDDEDRWLSAIVLDFSVIGYIGITVGFLFGYVQ